MKTGNRDCLKHTVYQKVHFTFNSDEWQLPQHGTFNFDLVLPRIPLDAKKVLDDFVLQHLRKAISESDCNFRDRLTVMRLIAHQLILTPDQLRDFLEIFPPWQTKYGRMDGLAYDFKPRADAYRTLYNRTLYHSIVVSPAVLYNPDVFHTQEIREIQLRLGFLHTLDLLNLHEKHSNLGTCHGPLDMGTYDGWIILKLMMQISGGEDGVNFFDAAWSENPARGYVFIIPEAWVPDPPQCGTFTTTFKSDYSEVKYARRAELAKKFLGWTFPPNTNLNKRSWFLERFDERSPSPGSPGMRRTNQRRSSTDF
jgi:hypothetical protein